MHGVWAFESAVGVSIHRCDGCAWRLCPVWPASPEPLTVAVCGGCAGNDVTSHRICSGLQAAGCAVRRLDAQVASKEDVVAACRDGGGPDVTVLVHAVRAGRLCRHVSTPFVLLLSGEVWGSGGHQRVERHRLTGTCVMDGSAGTDVNVVMALDGVVADDRADVAMQVLRRAAGVVAFTEAAVAAVATFCARAKPAAEPFTPPTVAVLPQAVHVPDLERLQRARRAVAGAGAGAGGAATPAGDHPSLRSALKLRPDARVLLLPCGLRAVKDPLFFAAEAKSWHDRDARVHFVIVGPPLDAVTSSAVRATAGACGWLAGLWPLTSWSTSRWLVNLTPPPSWLRQMAGVWCWLPPSPVPSCCNGCARRTSC